MTIEEINKRCEEIQAELSKEEITTEEVEKLEEEVNQLSEERKTLVEKAEKRKEVLTKVINEKNEKEENPMEERKKENNMNKEYRSAYLKKLMGRELNEEETRAYAQSGVAGAMPEETSDIIITKITKLAPVLDDITLLNVKGGVKFAVEGVKKGANIHKENEAINPDADTLVTVSLGGYEVTKLVQVSKSVATMTISAFEVWLTDMIAGMLAEKIEDQIFNGSGESEAKGILAEEFVDDTNAVKVANSYSANDVRKLVGLLPAGYDKNAKMYMNKKTLFNNLMALQDNAKHDLVREINGVFYVYGYEVKLSDKIADGVIVLGDFKKYVGNLALNDEVVSQFDINTNSYKYLGCAIFDGKTALKDAFVKSYIGA